MKVHPPAQNDAYTNLIESGRRLPSSVRCDRCGERSYEDRILRIELTGQKVCLGCIARLTIDDVKDMAQNEPEAVITILKQIYPDPKERDIKFELGDRSQSAEK